ncbi:hypothetical protein O9X99_02030 [Agrobacterium salinitolerans]|uniref:Uncharacterized protein n=1 Tax=Agrobacterium salinitolerans TaxID=1183413 RepID=A0ABY3BW52_9HYPH|nr:MULTISPECIES: hypothetical protein [Agrobacterium]MCZ7890446.1 hypothetical protein [Agrobacterium salinitolerans]TRA96832.1 hypothetical protein EXN23_00925 [Agrobacterium salinitolerans]
MPITAKLIDENGNVTLIDYPKDPTDIELLTTLGATEKDHLLTYGQALEHEVLMASGGGKNKLVIGVPPYSYMASRKSCSLSDDMAKNLITGIAHVWQLNNK